MAARYFSGGLVNAIFDLAALSQLLDNLPLALGSVRAPLLLALKAGGWRHFL